MLLYSCSMVSTEAPVPITRETLPLYACVTLEINRPKITVIYNKVINELLRKNRRSELSYVNDMMIHSPDIKTDERLAVLLDLAEMFKSKGVEFGSCYLDMLGRDSLNLGMYFYSEDQLEELKKKYKKQLNVTSLADMQVNSSYKYRNRDEIALGHPTEQTHINGIRLKEMSEY